jgi:hypothetical protein
MTGGAFDDWWSIERDDGRSRDGPVERNVRSVKYSGKTMIVIRNRGDHIRNVAVIST